MLFLLLSVRKRYEHVSGAVQFSTFHVMAYFRVDFPHIQTSCFAGRSQRTNGASSAFLGQGKERTVLEENVDLKSQFSYSYIIHSIFFCSPQFSPYPFAMKVYARFCSHRLQGVIFFGLNLTLFLKLIVKSFESSERSSIRSTMQKDIRELCVRQQESVK